MPLLPKVAERFDVAGRGGRVWTCQTPPAEAWVLAGYTLGLMARGSALGTALARLVHEPPERRAALVAEILGATEPRDREAQEQQQRERLESVQRAWAHLLPGSVVSCRVGEQSCPVRVVLTAAEEGDDEQGERVWVGNTALLDDWHAIYTALNARFGRGAELGERFRGGSARGPAAGGSDGAQVRPDAV